MASSSDWDLTPNHGVDPNQSVMRLKARVLAQVCSNQGLYHAFDSFMRAFMIRGRGGACILLSANNHDVHFCSQLLSSMHCYNLHARNLTRAHGVERLDVVGRHVGLVAPGRAISSGPLVGGLRRASTTTVTVTTGRGDTGRVGFGGRRAAAG